MTDRAIFRILLLVAAMLCFFGVAIFANSMDGANEIIRIIAAGLGLFAASFIP
jgi:hypothetical protein